MTPNTDVSCNREIKFGALLERLPSASGEPPWFATGHYARKAWSHTPGRPLRPQLVRPTDRHKDQTYYLSSISEHGLRRALFPLSDLPKPEVRELARQHGLHNSDRPDSVGICFVGEKGKFSNFLGWPAAPSHNVSGTDLLLYQPTIFPRILVLSSTNSVAGLSDNTTACGATPSARIRVFLVCPPGCQFHGKIL